MASYASIFTPTGVRVKSYTSSMPLYANTCSRKNGTFVHGKYVDGTWMEQNEPTNWPEGLRFIQVTAIYAYKTFLIPPPISQTFKK